MYARNRRVSLSNGITFDTPLLVPGLSSMALGEIEVETSPGGRSEFKACSIVHSEMLTYAIFEALLVSAYDIHHKHLADVDAFKAGFEESRYAQVDALFIDSGWYEKNTQTPGALFTNESDPPLSWDEDDYKKTIDELESNIKALVVGWDYSGQYDEQIEHAQEFFGERSRFASAILLKAPGRGRYHHFQNLSETQASNMSKYDVIGVTEKELGNSVIDRLIELARLRKKLDEVEVTAPIQVFGGLDPLYTPLYFAAGAEIFDGLGWLRYAYRDGIAIHRDAGILIDKKTTEPWMPALHMIQVQNLEVLRELGNEMTIFAYKRGDWSIFRTERYLRPVYELFEANLGKPHGQ